MLIYIKNNLRLIYHLEQSAPYPYYWTMHMWLLVYEMNVACKFVYPTLTLLVTGSKLKLYGNALLAPE